MSASTTGREAWPATAMASATPASAEATPPAKSGSRASMYAFRPDAAASAASCVSAKAAMATPQPGKSA